MSELNENKSTTTTIPQPSTPLNTKPQKTGLNLQFFISIAGIISGFLSCFFGKIILDMPTGYDYSLKEYGGDAYTGIQQAAAQTAVNVHKLNKIIASGIGYLLIVLGIVVVLVFTNQLIKKK